jgi:hypothetical protein
MLQGVMLVDAGGRYLEVNPAAARTLGLDRKTLLSCSLPEPWSNLSAADGTAVSAEEFPGLMVLKTGKPVRRKTVGWNRGDGSTLWLEVSAEPLQGGGALLSFDDITEHRVQSRKLERLTELYSALSQINQAIVWSPTKEALLDKISKVMVEIGRFAMSWIGWNDPETHEVRIVSRFGDKHGYLDGMLVRSDDTALGQGATGIAIREEHVCVVNDFLGSSAVSPWHDAARRSGFAASAAVPIRQDGKVCGALMVYATEKDCFGGQEIGLLEKAAGDITLALDNHELAAQRKRGEKELNREKTFTRALLDNLIEGVVACDRDGDLVLFNRTLTKWQGMDALKLPQDQWAKHYGLFEADGTTPLETHSNPLARSFNGEVLHDIGLVICAKDQPPRHLLCNGAPILDETNQKLGAVVTMHDITQRRKNEELLQNTLQRLELATTSANMGVWDWDLQLGTMTWDDRMFELYGTSHGEIQGTVQDWKDALHPEDLDRAIAECEAAIRGEVPFNTEFRVQHRNGTILWIKANAVVLRDQQGKPVRMIGLNQDITEQHDVQEQICRLSRDLEKRVEERTAQLELANKEMEAFNYSVSHDLRAPLQSIKGFSEILLGEYWKQLDDNGKRYLQRIRAGTQRMGDLITNLLRLSKASRSELNLADCDLSRLSSEIANDLTMANPPSRVEIAIQPGMMVQADHHLMQVVLQNLLGNAWKFTSRCQAPRIEVGEIVSPGGGKTFFVRDNGAGFDMAHADKLFNAFQRLHSTSEFEGTGLGLAIVQRIISRHGGRVWAKGEPGKGATFFFTIPERIGQ